MLFRSLTLLSGGIDSPVAAYMLMGRGCAQEFLTFHSYPYTDLELIEKLARLTARLNEFQPAGQLFACNLAPAQKVLRDACRPRYRTVLYRRLMMRVATRLARAREHRMLVTGESVGQVASQTIPNMTTIDQATDMLVLRPLAGVDKEQTVATARRIGTFDISTVDCADSCTVFQPDNPSTNTPVDVVRAEEQKAGGTDALLALAWDGLERVDLPTAELVPAELPTDIS